MTKIKNPIYVDFDGVIAEYKGWKGKTHFGKPLTGAKKFLEKLGSVGLKFNIFTTRSTLGVKKWLEKYKFPMPKKITNNKSQSPVYIDDRCIKFNGNFDKLLKDLEGFNVHWKKDKIFKEYFSAIK